MHDTKLAAAENAALDPYKFMATIGKRVIHPGGPASTRALTRRAGLSEISTESGPFETMTPRGLLSDEGAARSLAIMGRVVSRPTNMRKMRWLMPRMAKAAPYLGYILLEGTKLQ